MTRTSTGTVLVELSRDECLRLLATQSVGRIAVGGPGQPPLVVPVNFVLDGEVVVFRTDAGEKLRGLQQGPASFEVDEFDPEHRTGWSVLVYGVALEATSAEMAHLKIEPWVPGRKDWWVRLVPGVISGRRIRVVDATG